jgi:hypothetical protein
MNSNGVTRKVTGLKPHLVGLKLNPVHRLKMRHSSRDHKLLNLELKYIVVFMVLILSKGCNTRYNILISCMVISPGLLISGHVLLIRRDCAEVDNECEIISAVITNIIRTVNWVPDSYFQKSIGIYKLVCQV